MDVFPLNSKYYALLSLTSTVSGALLLLFYLKWLEEGIPPFILVVATVLLEFGAVCSYKTVENKPGLAIFSLLSTVILAVTLSVMPSIRFTNFSGMMVPDNFGEYYVAKATLGSNSWGNLIYQGTSEVALGAYSKCLSITIFPTVISELSGLSLFAVFEYVFPIIFSIIPVLVFLLSKEVFGSVRVAVLSSILYTECYFLGTPSLERQSMALIFLVLAILLAIRLEKNKLRSKIGQTTLLIVFGFGVITSHYTLAYFLDVIFLSIVLAGPVFTILSRIRNLKTLRFDTQARSLHKYAFVCFVVLSASWLFFVNIAYTTQNILEVKDSILATLGIIEPKWLSSLWTPGTFLSPVSSAWYVFQLSLIGLGFLLILLRKTDDKKKVDLVLVGFVMLVILFLSIVIPILSRDLSFNRVIFIGLPVLVCFLGYALASIEKRFGKFLLYLFLSVNLILNMSLLSYGNYVLFSPEKNVAPELAVLQAYNREPEFAMSTWVSMRVPSTQTISVDRRGWISMIVNTLNPLEIVPTPSFGTNSSYLALGYFALNYGLWWPTSLVSVGDLQNSVARNSNRIYDNGQSVLVMRIDAGS